MISNEAIVRRYLEAVWNAGDTATLDELVGEGFRAGGELAVLFPPPYEGPAGVQARLEAVRAAFGDFTLTIADIRGQGDTVAVDWTVTCVHRGMFLGYPPTGRRLTVPGHSTFRLRQGKIIARQGRIDRLGLIRQLSPSPEGG